MATKKSVIKIPSGEMGAEDVMRRFKDAYRDEKEKLGCFNLALFGKTGVGKSTLVNSMFGETIALTGNGRPVTEGVDFYPHPDGLFGVYDSEGIETGEDVDDVLHRFCKVIRDKRRGPITEHIHVIWYCLRWSDRRFEESQAKFVKGLAAEDVPVIFVLTQVPRNAAGDLHPEALELAEHIKQCELPLAPANIVFHTMAVGDPFSGHEAHGVQELLDATFRVAPEGVRLALVAAQKIDLERKAHEARKMLAPAAAAAAGAGAVPIPFADAALLVPLQVGMMAKIAAVFGLRMRTGTLATLAGGAFAGGGVTQAGKYLVTNLLKAVPGANVVAGVIRAGVASSLTYAVGEAWIAVCTQLHKMGPSSAENIPAEEVRKLFMEEFKTAAKRRRV